MNDIKNKSLEELETLYRQKLQQWSDRRAEHLKQAEECEQQMAAYEQKLRHIVAIVNGQEAAAALQTRVPTAQAAYRRTGKRRRRSPLREATLMVLRNRPGRKLTARQIRTAMRKDANKRCSRQTVNNNVTALEEMGLIRRERAPRGSGAQFVFWAV